MTHPLPDKAVEAGARAIYRAVVIGGVQYDDLSERLKAEWRKNATIMISALAAEGLCVVPREPTAKMLDAVVAYPAGLVAERNDPEYTAQMQAATATERALAAQRYRAMIAAAQEGQ
jgi:hypothetical protein